MKTSRALSLVSLLVPFTLAAQTPAQNTSASDPAIVRSANASCPVGIEVRNVTKGRYLPVAMYGFFQDIQVELTNTSQRGVVASEIVVLGFNGKPHLRNLALELGSDVSDPAELRETMSLEMKVGAADNATRELRLERFSGIAAVYLTGVTYADGSTWKAERERTCTASLINAI